MKKKIKRDRKMDIDRKGERMTAQSSFGYKVEIAIVVD